MWWLAALIGGAISIVGNLAGKARRSAAREEAIQQGAYNLAEGQAMTAQNAAALAQDNAYVMSLSGVSATEGTASQIQQQISLQKKATISKMDRDFQNYVTNLRNADDADALNTAFSVAGEVFNTAGRLFYDNTRVGLLDSFKTAAPPSRLGPDIDISKQFVNPGYVERLGSLTGPQVPDAFRQGKTL